MSTFAGLRYFVAVAEELHFTRAAERLHIAQPSLSRQIRSLEQDLRVELLIRDSRDVAITTAGQALLRRARSLLEIWQDTETEVRELAAHDSAVLRVGFTASFSGTFTRRLTETCHQLRPGWRLRWVLSPWTDLSGGIRTRTADVALIWQADPHTTEYQHQRLRHDTRLAVLAADHPLALRPQPPTVPELLRCPLAVPTHAGTAREQWYVQPGPDYTPPAVVEVTHPDEWREVIAAQQAIGVVPASISENYARPDLAFRDFNATQPFTLSVAWRPEWLPGPVRDFIRTATTLTKRQPTTG
jgi:DNA-binding transcriptional LysR family regulator